MSKLKDGRDVMVEVKRSRSPRHHRLYWAIIRFIAMHCPRFEGVPQEKIHIALKLATGHVDTFIDAETGKVCYVPRSIAFDALDQTQFNAFFDDAVRIIVSRWMPEGVAAEDVRREILAMCDGHLR